MGADIMSSGLTESAEKIRREIKAMIPGDSEEGNLGKAETPPTTIDDGDVMYGGHNLAKKVSELMKVMEIDKWIWTVAQFHKAKKINNDLSKMYIIPLSDNFTLSIKTDKGTTERQPVLNQGYYAYIKISPIICAGASVIFIFPPAE